MNTCIFPPIILNKILWYRKRNIQPILYVYSSNNIFPSIILDKIYWYKWKQLNKIICQDIPKKVAEREAKSARLKMYAMNWNALRAMSGYSSLTFT